MPCHREYFPCFAVLSDESWAPDELLCALARHEQTTLPSSSNLSIAITVSDSLGASSVTRLTGLTIAALTTSAASTALSGMLSSLNSTGHLSDASFYSSLVGASEVTSVLSSGDLTSSTRSNLLSTYSLLVGKRTSMTAAVAGSVAGSLATLAKPGSNSTLTSTQTNKVLSVAQSITSKAVASNSHMGNSLVSMLSNLIDDGALNGKRR